MDEYDCEYDELIENNFVNSEEDTYDYFHNLQISDKKCYLTQLKEINNINQSNIPLKFKVLNSKMDIKTKSLAINNLNQYFDSDSNGEYVKMEQWINGLIQIPFGNYKKLPILNDDDISKKQEYFINAKKILDNSIYGHLEAKTYILQTIGKWIKNPYSSGII